MSIGPYWWAACLAKQAWKEATFLEDHQMLNARALEKAGAADVIAQNELTVEWLASYVMEVMEDRSRRTNQARAARACANVHAAIDVATLIEQVHYAKK